MWLFLAIILQERLQDGSPNKINTQKFRILLSSPSYPESFDPTQQLDLIKQAKVKCSVQPFFAIQLF